MSFDEAGDIDPHGAVLDEDSFAVKNRLRYDLARVSAFRTL
jgi:hypothetical protein